MKECEAIIQKVLNEGRSFLLADEAQEHEAIKQLDLNPLIVYSDGVCAVDCRIIIGQGSRGV